MFFSRACEYGIRAMLYLATQPKAGGPVLVRDVAQDLKIPSPFLSKIVQTLAREGLINSQKGPGGGITLARPASEIRLIQVVEAIDDLEFTQACVLGLPDCGDSKPCPVHEQWGKIRERIRKMLESRTIARFAKQLKDQEYVLVR